MLRRLLGGANERRSISYQDIFKRGLNDFSGKTTSGVNVTYDSALSVSAVYGAVRLISDTISHLDFSTYFRRGGVELPFGGVGHSGFGREKGIEALNSFSILKTVAVNHG